MQIIDAHVHAWPDAIADRALNAPDEGLRRIGDGKVSGLLAALERAGVDMGVCLTIANEARHVETNNRFAATLTDPLVPFGSIHAGLDAETNVRSLRENGLRGAKINPPFQGFSLDDPGLAETLDAMQGEFVVLTHVGEGGDAGSHDTCTPAMVRDLARQFPNLDIIAAHLGGYRVLGDAESEVIGLPVYIDTSWPPDIGVLDPARVRRVIERHGPERVLFGSDWPMGDPATALAAVEALGLADEDLRAILGENAARLLRLSEVGTH